MRCTCTFDDRQFQAAARALFQESSRTLVDFTNGQALKVEVEAVRQTHKAASAQIQHELGATGNAVEFKLATRGRNRGRTVVRRKGLIVDDVGNSLAWRILLSRFKKTGSFGVRGNSRMEMVRRFIAIRARSAGFIASGWVWARNRLWSHVRKKPTNLASMAGVRIAGRPKGDAHPAIFNLTSKITSDIGNTALHTSREPSVAGDPMRVGVVGLQRALNVAARDMENELARRLNPELRKVSAR